MAKIQFLDRIDLKLFFNPYIQYMWVKVAPAEHKLKIHETGANVRDRRELPFGKEAISNRHSSHKEDQNEDDNLLVLLSWFTLMDNL